MLPSQYRIHFLFGKKAPWDFGRAFASRSPLCRIGRCARANFVSILRYWNCFRIVDCRDEISESADAARVALTQSCAQVSLNLQPHGACR